MNEKARSEAPANRRLDASKYRVGQRYGDCECGWGDLIVTDAVYIWTPVRVCNVSVKCEGGAYSCRSAWSFTEVVR